MRTPATHGPSTRTARFATLAVVALALVGSGLIVSQASHAAFSADTSNDGNDWALGSVALEDDATSALFSAKNLKPGSTETHCIAVTSKGSLPSAVRLYATNLQQTADLGSHVSLRIRQGTGGGYGTCNGFTPASDVYAGTLADLARTSTSYATGKGAWETTGADKETAVYEFTYAVDSDAPNSLMGSTASVDFTWEAQNL